MAGEPHAVEGTRAFRTPSTWCAFVIVLGVATVIDHAPMPRILFDSWIEGTPLDDPGRVWLRTAWILTALWALVRPSAVGRYLALCVVGSVVILHQLPRVPNHWILELGIYGGSLLVATGVRDPRERFAAFRVLILGSIFAVYAWTFLHKLNTGFLDPETSCGTTFVDSLGARLRLPSMGGALREATVVAVLIVEGAMPALVLSTRLRALAILLGVGLHLMFGLFVAGFSLLMWATYFLLLPPSSIDAVSAKARRVLAPVSKRVPDLGSFADGPKRILWLVLISIVVLLIKEVPRFRGLTQQETLLLPIGAVVGTVLIASVVVAHGRMQIAWPRARGLALALVFPTLLLANGSVPYFGIRNTLAFSMFSNLRTENGVSNHLFLPSVVTPLSVLDDEVRVVESSDRVLSAYTREQHRIRWNWTALIGEGQKAKFELPFSMIRYRAQELRERGEPMFSVTLERRGKTQTLEPEDVAALAPVGWIDTWMHWSKGTPLPPHEAPCMW